MTPILELRNVRKAYGKFVAVDGVTMAVPTGSIFGLLGPNGAGKTSSIRMIMNITAPDSGEVQVFGHPRTADDLRRIGYLPEERGLYRKMTVMDQLVFLGEIRGLKGPKLVADIQRWLERVELSQWSKSKIEELSKGMQQKVQLIGTVLHQPDLLILDEPFSGLDPVNQEVMEQVIRDLQKAGHTIVFSTHVMEHAERLCDRILLIARGTKVFDGTIAEAKRTVPRRVRIETGSNVDPLRSVHGVTSIERVGSDGMWDVTLSEGANPDEILRTCFKSGVELRSFDRKEPGLRDVFIKLVGHEAAEGARS
jgi:ABC-2 type transport system ATP-binding protein